MNILVTGGCGFIGSHFVELLLRQPGYRVVNVDALTYAAHPSTPARLAAIAPGRYRFVQMDIGSGNIGPLLREHNIDAVVNFAAESHVDRSILDPAIFVRSNVLGVQNLLHATRLHGGARFVQVSTDEVYGSLEPGDAAFTEKSELHPNSPYAGSKAAADLLIQASHRTFKQDIVITRCTNNYGPYQFPEKLIPLVIGNALDGRDIPIYGDGQQVRDWIYVVDHCRAVLDVMLKGKSGEIYNVSAACEKPNLETVKTILKLVDAPTSLMKSVGDRPAHDRRYGLDATKIQNELGWKPSLSFDQGLAATVDWYRTHSEWWKKLRDEHFEHYYRANYADKFAQSGKTEA